ncbi:MAG: RidA family protein [Acidobacteriota bacterium]
MLEKIYAKDGPKPVGPYSPAIRANGFIFVSGQGPIDPRTSEINRGPIPDQVRQTLDNIKAILEAAGSSMDKIVKSNVYLADISNFEIMNEAYSAYFGDHKPARTTIQAGALPKRIDVEVEVIALE